MGIPARPRYVKQLDGSRYAGLNCGMAATAMAIDVATLGKTRVSAATCRAVSGDTVAGTTLDQERAVAAHYGVALEIHRPGAFLTLETALHAGRHASVSGSSSATKGTRWQASETFAGNHQWFVNEGRGWTEYSIGWRADDYLVYDPLADGRRAGIAKAPFWLPRAYLLRFAGLLQMGSGSRLGFGLGYFGLTRDTEPHTHFHYGGARLTTRTPDRMRISVGMAALHSSPGGPVLYHLKRGDLFTAFQQTPGWFGDHWGTKWVAREHVSHIGGTT